MIPPVLPDSIASRFTISASFLLFPFVSCIYLVLRYYAWGRSLRKLPGPFVASLSPLWLAYHAWIGDVHRQTVKLHQQYGSLVRLGPNEVSVIDSDAVRTIYGTPSLWYIHCSLTGIVQVQLVSF